MILEYLLKRSRRDRLILAGAALAVILLAGYVVAVGPSLASLSGARSDLETVQAGLDLQRRQLDWLRTETEARQKTLAQLQDAPCPWISADKVDGVLEELQKAAADLGLTVRAVIREHSEPVRIKEGETQVALLAVRMELSGPYASVAELLRRLGKGPMAVGLQELSIKSADEPPYDVEVALVVRLPVVEGAKHA